MSELACVCKGSYQLPSQTQLKLSFASCGEGFNFQVLDHGFCVPAADVAGSGRLGTRVLRLFGASLLCAVGAAAPVLSLCSSPVPYEQLEAEKSLQVGFAEDDDVSGSSVVSLPF